MYIYNTRGVTQFHRISKGEALLCSKVKALSFSKGKVTSLKLSGFFFKKVCPQTPLFGFFVD